MFNDPFQNRNSFLHNKSQSVTNINLLDIYIYIYIYNMTFGFLVGKIQIYPPPLYFGEIVSNLPK